MLVNARCKQGLYSKLNISHFKVKVKVQQIKKQAAETCLVCELCICNFTPANVGDVSEKIDGLQFSIVQLHV